MDMSDREISVLEKIRSMISDKGLKDVKMFAYGITDSTNTRAREYAEAGGAMPAVFIADGQTEGRGRRGRAFDSAMGAGLYVSFLLRPEKKGLDGAMLTVKAAVDTCLALEEVCGLSASIKWVNDILVGQRKLAGILAEGRADALGGFEYAILGIGINLNKRAFPEELCKIVTTVEDETGKRPDRELLAAALIERVLSERRGSDIEEYRRRSAVLGRSVTVRRLSGEEFSARAVAITDGGALAVVREGGVREELISAEVSIKMA